MPNPNEPLREKIHRALTSFETTVLATRGSSYHRAYARNEVATDLEQLIADDKHADKSQADLKGQRKVWNILRNGNEGFVNEAGNVELTPEHMDLMLSGLSKLLKEEVKEL